MSKRKWVTTKGNTPKDAVKFYRVTSKGVMTGQVGKCIGYVSGEEALIRLQFGDDDVRDYHPSKVEQVTQVIDCTPTWVSILPWYLGVLEDGNEEGKKIARQELLHMAQVADKYVAYIKGTESEEPEETSPKRVG